LISTGALPQTPLGELTALHQTPSWILGVLLLGEGREEEKKSKSKKGKAGRGGTKKEGKGKGDEAPQLKFLAIRH